MMYVVYCCIFEVCGFDYMVVEVDFGVIGGLLLYEFMVIVEIGEDVIVYCDECGYVVNVEKVMIEFEVFVIELVDEVIKVVMLGMMLCVEVVEYFGVLIEMFVKMFFYEID